VLEIQPFSYAFRWHYSAFERHDRMSMVMVHFTPTIDLLNATSLHRRTVLLCRACLKLRLDHRERFHFRASCPKSYEQIVGLSSCRKESRGLQRSTVALPRSFEELLGNPVERRGRQFRSWCVSAKAVHPLDELQSAEDLRAQLEALQQEAELVRSKGTELFSLVRISCY